MKRRAKKVFDSEFRVDGNFIHFDTAIGYDMVYDFDPFLLFDMYGENRQPQQRVFHNTYHAHRGMETITYVRSGEVTHTQLHKDAVVVKAKEALLLSAGEGFIHEERTVKKEEIVSVVQVWVNLAKKDKWIQPVQKKIAVQSVKNERMEVSVVAGKYQGVEGLLSSFNDEQFYEVTMEPKALFTQTLTTDKTVFIYVYQGEVIVEGRRVKEKQIALLKDGDEVEIFAEGKSTLFYFEATPHNENIAWGGTISMNEKSELEKASQEIIDGTFGKE